MIETGGLRSATVQGPAVPVAPLAYAGLGRRFLALLIDLILFCLVFFPTTRLVKGVWLMTPPDHRWASGWFISDPLCVVFFIVMAAYYIALEAVFGATLGKWCLRLRVVDMLGNAPGWRKSLIRNGLRVIDGLPALNLLGVLLILTTRERTRVGDLAARTRVVVTAASNARRRVIVERPNRRLAGLSFCAAGRPSELATARYREIVRNLRWNKAAAEPV